MSKKDRLTAYQRAIMEISPLLSYVAPIKQRAVLEVLYRKSVGFAVEFSAELGQEEIRLSFDFDEGLPITVPLATSGFELEHVRDILHDHMTSRVFTVMPNRQMVVIAHMLDKDTPIYYSKKLTKFSLLEDELTFHASGETPVELTFNDVEYGLDDDEDLVD